MTRSRSRLVPFLLLVSILAPWMGQDSPAADLEESPQISIQGSSDRFKFKIGSYFTSLDTSVRADSIILGLVGTVVDFENSLGLDSGQNTLRVDAIFRFNARHRLRSGFFDLERDSLVTVEEEVQIGDILIPAGAETFTTFDTEFWQLKYQYAFFNEPRAEVGFTAGFAVMGVDLEVLAEATVDGQIGELEENFDIVLPIPVIGFYSELTLSRRLFLDFSVDFFDLSYDEFDGNLLAFDTALAFYFSKNIGLALGYTFSTVDFRYKDEDDLNLKFDYEITGVGLFLTMAFGKTPGEPNRPAKAP